MATSTYTQHLVSSGDAKAVKPGIFNKLLKHIVDVQTAKARTMTAEFLSGVSDQELLSYGWELEDIKRLRNR